MDKVLITGAAGFLGSHLCDRFIKEGYHVIGMDNLLTGSLDNIQHLFALKQFEGGSILSILHVLRPLYEIFLPNSEFLSNLDLHRFFLYLLLHFKVLIKIFLQIFVLRFF